MAAVDAVIRGASLSLSKALQMESRVCGELIATEVSKNLIHIFQDSEDARRLVVDDGAEAAWPKSGSAGVLGAGELEGGGDRGAATTHNGDFDRLS